MQFSFANSTMATKSCFPWFFYFYSIIIIITSSINGGASGDDRKVYIVYMGSLPQGEYSPISHHLSILEEVINGSLVSDHLVQTYTRSFNGFAARLNSQERQKIASMDGVVSVFPSRNLRLQTTRSWGFMGFPESVKRIPIVESEVIIGVFDSGIWLQSDSFNDKGFSRPPKKWKGVCEGGKNFTCNNKVIGARVYTTFEGDAIDHNGHGTHTASTAAGNIVKSVSFYGLAPGNARGGVPSARIAVYKVCYSIGFCEESKLLAAFDDAISDGVDIITASVGGTKTVDFFSNSLAIGAFHALKKGVLTSNSAGNSGPQAATVSSVAPWLLTVAASSIDRQFIDKVVLGDGTTLVGKSVNRFQLNGTKFPLVYGKDVSRFCTASMAKSCKLGCLDNDLVKGKIVLCDQFKGIFEAVRANALGAILLDNRRRDFSVVVPLPATVLSTQDGNKLKSYKNSTKTPQANILKSEAIKDSAAPTVVSFSSRGPNKITRDIIKPDITAPGVNILAAVSPLGRQSVNYSLASGTSMSCPHAAAAAAYVKTFHPQWSPSAIKSALMTTARSMRSTKSPDREFAYGAGFINPVRAVNPGLVYDAVVGNYIKMLCDSGYDSKKLRAISGDNSSCPEGKKGTAKDLNYPSMAAYVDRKKPFNVQFHRTVTNCGRAKSTYKVNVSTDPRFSINVIPKVLFFNSLGEQKSFVVSVVGGGLPAKSIVSGSLMWFDRTHTVRSPVLVYTT